MFSGYKSYFAGGSLIFLGLSEIAGAIASVIDGSGSLEALQPGVEKFMMGLGIVGLKHGITKGTGK